MSLLACRACDGLVPRGHAVCPHCDRPLPRRFGRLIRLVSAGAAMMTLMACYGMMARPMGPMNGPDNDGDGAADDCDDTRRDVYPGAPDLDGDGVDQNCDGADGWRDPSLPAPAPAEVAVDPATPTPTPPPTPVKAIAVDPAP